MKYSSSSVVFLTIFLSLSFSVYGHPSGASAAWDSFLNFTGCQYGDDIVGLSTLKQYFHRFGYIPDSPSNFSDAFDDALEAALKAYQQNFNLNASGVLDAATVAQLVQPRCGVPDMVNGSTTMKSGKLNTLNTVAHFTFFSGRPSWGNKKDLTYAFEPSSAQIVDPQVLRTIFTKAFARWSAVTPLTFQEETNYAAANLKIGFFSGDHGDGEPFDGVLGTLAHAYSPTDGRFHLDADEKWSFDEKSIGLTEIDLESVAVHEIGHLLGLGHSSVEGAIMFPTITSGARKVQLAGDDIDGIQELYGANPSPSGSTGVSNDGPSVQERETSDGGVHIGPGLVRFFGVGLGFYLWGLLMM